MTTTISNTSDREIVISRIFDAPRELVWEAWTNPAHVVKWWGPRGFTTTIEEMNVRPGGVWKHVMHGPDGAEFPNESIFTEVVKPERIVFTQGGRKKDGPEVQFVATWTFDAVEGNKTEVTIRMVFPTAAARDTVVREYGAIEGGKQTLARLAEELAKTPVVVERTFDAPVDLVWKALTNKEDIKQWSFDIAEFKAEVGFEFQFSAGKGDEKFLHLCKITEAVSGKKLAYTWRYDGYEGNSLVTIELFPEGKKTRLKLTHTGLETFLLEKNPDFARGNFFKGWTYLIGSSLANFVENAAPADDSDFRISRVFDAPRELVWKVWTETEHMAQWWGPHDFTCPICELDVRVGGAYRLVMRAPRGGEYPCKGFYLEVVKPERLVMSMDLSDHPDSWFDLIKPDRDRTKKPVLDCVQTVTFEEIDGKTKLTIRTRFESKTVRDAMVKAGMNEGWSESLERMAASVSSLSAR